MRDHRKEDRMESFFLAETTKYLYLLFDTENFMHNQGNQGTVIQTPNGECVIETGGYIFNTEAHPIDPSALHCCHSMPRMKFYDFKEFRAKKSLFRGEALEDSKSITVEIKQQNETVEDTEGEDNEVTTIELNSSYVKLEDNDNVSIKINGSELNEEENGNNETENSSSMQQFLEDSVTKFDPQEMLERIRDEHKYFRNESWQGNFKLMSCKAQPFLQRISIMGEFFNV